MKDAVNQTEGQRMSSNWEKYLLDMTKDVVGPQILVDRDGAELLARGDISMISGLPGSCKTFIASAIAAACIGGESEDCLGFRSCEKRVKVLFVDTEQSLHSTYKVCRRILRMSGLDENSNIDTFLPLKISVGWLRIIYTQPYKPTFIFIPPPCAFLDGILDGPIEKDIERETCFCH